MWWLHRDRAAVLVSGRPSTLVRPSAPGQGDRDSGAIGHRASIHQGDSPETHLSSADPSGVGSPKSVLLSP